MAAGIVALVLQARPDLSWRDMQYLTLKTAVPVNLDDDDWVETATGAKYNHKYGYGKLDAYAMVRAAETFEKLKPQAWYHSPVLTVNHQIPEGETGLRTEIVITKEQLEAANLDHVEQITVTMNAKHPVRGEMSVDLVSPSGLVSNIATARKPDISKEGYKDWKFMTVKHWYVSYSLNFLTCTNLYSRGESGVGTWAVIIKDHVPNGKTGTLIDWQINLWGESIDPAKAVAHPYPGDQSPPPGEHPTSTPAIVTTTSVVAPHPTTKPTQSVPDNHVDRPTKPRPTASTTETPSSTSTPSAQESDKSKSGFLWSFMPSFSGFSKTTQAWIWMTVGAIVLFIAGLAIYIYKKSHKDHPDGRDYEFQQLAAEDLEDATDDEDHEGGANGGGVAAGGKKKKAKELYDAFRPEDDDDEFFGDDSSDDGDGRGYQERRYSSDDVGGTGSGSGSGSAVEGRGRSR